MVSLDRVSSYVVVRSAFIATRQEAVDYFAARLAGEHSVVVFRRPVVIIVPRDGAHMYSKETDAHSAALTSENRVVRRVAGGRVEERVFSIDRARLLDEVIPAIERFTVSVPGTGASGRGNRMLHGPALSDGSYLRVILRPGPGDAWTVVSSYPVNLSVWRSMVRAKRAKFPP